jgi:hypothetical protein
MAFSPSETARFTAAVHRREAEVRRASEHAHQREFAAVLDQWANDAEHRATEAERGQQGELFA